DDRRHLPRFGSGHGRDHRVVPHGRGRELRARAERAPGPGAARPRRRRAGAAARRGEGQRPGLPAVHVVEHGPPARRHAHPSDRDTSGLDLTSLKAALSGAEPVRLSTIEAFESHFGLKRVISPCYGLAEATLAVAIWPRGVPLRRDPSGHFLSVGKPCRGVSVRVLAPLDEGTAERPAGVEGEICVNSTGIMKGSY